MDYEVFNEGYINERDLYNPLYQEQVEESLYRINADENNDAIDNAIKILSDFGLGSVEEKNDKFTDYLQNGVPVTYYENDEEVATLRGN